jgi:hypothetical protein
MSKSKKAGTDRHTLVTFLLDETGSMESIKDDTIGGFNAYLGSLKAESAPIDFTLIKFDSRRIEKVCVAVPVAEGRRADRGKLPAGRLYAADRRRLQDHQGGGEVAQGRQSQDRGLHPDRRP